MAASHGVPLESVFTELWHGLVAAWRTLSVAFQAAGLDELPEVLSLQDIQAVCNAGCGSNPEKAERMANTLFRSLAGQDGGVPRASLLAGLGHCPQTRASFKDWANNTLLMYPPGELASALAVMRKTDQQAQARSAKRGTRPSQLLVPRSSFSEVLDLAEVHPDDAEAWFKALSEAPDSDGEQPEANNTQEALHVGTLVRRILAQPWLEKIEELESEVGGEEALAADVAVRLIHTWGDLTAAFGLRPVVERSSSASKFPSFLNMRRSSSTGSLGAGAGSPRSSRRSSVCSTARPSISSMPRASISGQRTSRCSPRVSISEITSITAEGIWPGAVSPASQAGIPGRLSPEGLPSREQWVHALRGSMRCRLLHEGQARTQAALMYATQASFACCERGGLAAFFPNLSDRLCISRTGYRKNELIIVRYSTSEAGFYGSCIAPPPDATSSLSLLSHQGADSSLDSPRRQQQHLAGGGRRPSVCSVSSAWGANPFLAVVPYGAEAETLIGKELGKPPSAAPLGGPRPQSGFGTAALRAPTAIRSGGVDHLWALQLFASEDGRHALVPIGAQLPFRVMAELPRAPHAPQLVGTGNTRERGASLTVAWAPPDDDGGANVLGHELGIWAGSAYPTVEGEPLLLRRGREVWPPFCVEGLQPSTRYVFRVRCESRLGHSPWSRPSLPFETPPPEPSDLGKPEVLNVLRTSVTVRWSTSSVPVTHYEVVVSPQNGRERWITTVDPPPPAGPNEGPADSQTEATIEGLLADTTYTFSVRGINETGSGPLSPLSDPVSTQPDVPSAPGAPELLEATQTSLTLAWPPPDHDGGCPVVRYFVQGRQASEHGDARAGAPTFERHTRDGATTLTVRKLSGNTRYVFWVYALNKSGLSPSSPPSEPLITGPVAPGPPTNIEAAEGEGSGDVDLRWLYPLSDGGSPVALYHLTVHLQDHPEQRFSVSTPSQEARLEGLRGNSRYTVRITSTNEAGSSASFAELVFRTGPVPPDAPGVPRLVGDLSAHTATLAWAPPADDGGIALLGYALQYQAQGDGTRMGSTCMVPAEKSQATVDCLAPEHSYRFRVQACNNAGEGPYSEWSAAVRTLVAPPPAPSPPAVVSATTQSLTVDWEDCSACSEVVEWEAVASCTEPEACPPHAQVRAARGIAPPLQVRGLLTRIPYALRARVRGPGGWSQWSDATQPCLTSERWSTEEIIRALICKFGSLSSAFRAFDRKCDGFLPLEDFMGGLDAAGFEELPEQQKLELFAEIDEGQRGCITLREFSKCFAKLGPLHPAPRRPSTARSGGGSPQPSTSPQGRRAPEVDAPMARRVAGGARTHRLSQPAPVSPDAVGVRLQRRRSLSPPVLARRAPEHAGGGAAGAGSAPRQHRASAVACRESAAQAEGLSRSQRILRQR